MTGKVFTPAPKKVWRGYHPLNSQMLSFEGRHLNFFTGDTPKFFQRGYLPPQKKTWMGYPHFFRGVPSKKIPRIATPSPIPQKFGEGYHQKILGGTPPPPIVLNYFKIQNLKKKIKIILLQYIT